MTPAARCLRQSMGFMAHLLRPGDRIDGLRIEQKLHDVNDEVVYLMEDDSYVEFPSLEEIEIGACADPDGSDDNHGDDEGEHDGFL